jgi:hypothetical protein
MPPASALIDTCSSCLATSSKAQRNSFANVAVLIWLPRLTSCPASHGGMEQSARISNQLALNVEK